MTRRRWIADEVSGTQAALVGTHAEHLARVLRASVGQEFDISTGSEVRRGRVTRVDSARVEFELGEAVHGSSALRLTLAPAIFKFDRMEWAIEKCTELGAARIAPLIAQRTDRHLAAAAVKRVERWQRIARQAAEQARRVAPPEVSPPASLREVLALPGLRIVLSEVERDVTLKEALGSSPEDIVVALGPEGGWTEEELAEFRDAGWQAASLGSAILRAETAAIAAAAVILSENQ